MIMILDEDQLQRCVNEALQLFVDKGLSMAQVVMVSDELLAVTSEALKEALEREKVKQTLKVIK